MSRPENFNHEIDNTAYYIKARNSSTTQFQLLQWLHGQQQQHKATCIRIYSRGRGRDRTPRPPGYPSRLYPRSALLKYTRSYVQLNHQNRGQRFVPGILGL